MSGRLRKNGTPRWIAGLVAGICYTTIGLFIPAGSTRTVLIGVGLLLVLLGTVGIIAAQRE